MVKAAVLVFCDTEAHADVARAVNALLTVREFKESGDDVRLIFDGAGTKWIGEFAKPEHHSHALYETVRDHIAGACSFCASAFGAKEAIQAAGIPLLDEYKRHPSLRRLVADGYQILTF